MPQRPLNDLLRSLRRLALDPGGAELTDRQLLERFAGQRSEAAFEVLVQRHGPLVLGVCLRVLQHVQDAEDAFQATFLVLARKAAKVRWQNEISNWLYAVAYRTALKTRGEAARRRAFESPLVDLAAGQSAPDLAWQELRPLLDEEVSRLPAKYRAPVILCYLEDKTYTEAARILGVAEGTVSSRLARAREKLRGRLARRGLTLSAGLLTTAVAGRSLSAAVPAELMYATLRIVAGRALAGTVPLHATALANEVMKAMFLTKLKIVAVVLLSAGMLGGAGAWSYRAAEHGVPVSDDSVQQENQRLKRELADANAKVRQLEDQLVATKGRSRAPLYQGKSAEYWIERLRDLDVGFRFEALNALGAIARVDRSVVPVIEEQLKDSVVCAPAADALARIGPDAIPKLADLLKDSNPRLRQGAVSGLKHVGPQAASALVEALKDTDIEVREGALLGITEFARREINEAEIKRSLPAVIPMVKDPRFWQLAMHYLYTIGPFAKPAVPILIEAMKNQRRDIRLQAIATLERIGPAAKAAVPSLLAVLDQNRSGIGRDVWDAAQKALANIDPEALKKVPQKEPAPN